MTRRLVEQVVNAVLYEGYILYPYRPTAVKNRQRWTFGGIYPQEYSRAQGGTEPCLMQAACLVQGSEGTLLDVEVRFLHLVDRQATELAEPIRQLPPDAESRLRVVEALRAGERVFHSWQEAVERAVAVPNLALGKLVEAPRWQLFAFPASRTLEPVTGPANTIVGALVRRQAVIAGSLAIVAERLDSDLFKITVTVENVTKNAATANRDLASLQAFVSAHTILGVRAGAFLSLLDPPECYRTAAAGCRNVGVWPVLVGEPGTSDTMLASPIILYDYPEVAPESPGDLFDGTEIDEILTLRILAMTDEEKQEMRQTDERARSLLDRTERLQPEQLARLHGAMRQPRPLEGKKP